MESIYRKRLRKAVMERSEMTNTLGKPFKHTHWSAPSLAMLLSLGLAACDSGSSTPGTQSPPPPLGPNSKLELSAWVGADNSQLTISGDYNGLEDLHFYLGQDPDCDVIADGETCAQEHKLTKQPFTFNDKTHLKLGLEQPLYARLRLGEREATTPVELNESVYAEFSPRSDTQVVRFDAGEGERLWLVGGHDGANNLNDIWSSTDGIHWEQVETAPGQPLFAPRSGHQLVVFEAKSDEESVPQGPQLWVIGGANGGNYFNDVWSSPDGVHWTEHEPVCTGDCFSARSDHQVVVFDANNEGERLWLIGGASVDGDGNNDVWSSVDGIHWHQVIEAADFPRRTEHQVVVFDTHDEAGTVEHQLWLVGGTSSDLSTGAIPFYNDVWSSKDGKKWDQQNLCTPKPCFVGRAGHELVVYAAPGETVPKLWLVGGRRNDINLNDIWSSNDGVEWNLETDAPSLSARNSHQLVVFGSNPDKPEDNALWMIGGNTYFNISDSNVNYNEVWRSTDGKDWRLSVKTPLQNPLSNEQ
ncbi:hypothetical protein ABMA57_09465 [Saccharospirillum sp. HFRX-1]|uniref:Kelch repeat-containing protein n=1 Tax=unclassified Saccharospirillum TaxID=2633430 RepID=UPI00370FE619